MEREEEVNLVRRFKESLFPDGASNGAKREKGMQRSQEEKIHTAARLIWEMVGKRDG